MYAAHQGGQALRAVFSVPDIHYPRDGKDATFWGLNGSASLHDRELVLTVVNPGVSEAREASIVLRGATVKSGTVAILTHHDIHARNTFTDPHQVKATTAELKAGGES